MCNTVCEGVLPLRWKRAALLVLVSVLLLCSGCNMGDTDELFCLPQPSEEYLILQSKIDEVLRAGAVYSAPASGAYRQSVQLYDIDGDGEDEAIAFFNTSGERPLKIYIYHKTDGNYEVAATIEGEGSGIDSIYYTDMDGDGWSEIIVGWRSSDIQMLNAYSLRGFQPAVIATSDYTQYTVRDLDSDGRDELFVIRHNGAEYGGTVDMYSIQESGDTAMASAKLSIGMETIGKLTTGLTSDKKAALFVEGGYSGSGIVTDIFVCEDEELKRITGTGSPVSEDTVRGDIVYCRDINSDGIKEVPIPRSLPSTNENAYRVLDWYAYSSSGTRKLVLTTYHNSSDGWYLVLPDEWGDDITLRREDSVSGERAVIFSVWRGENLPPEDFLIIYALSGENREDKAKRDGRFILLTEDEVIYAAELIISDGAWRYMVDTQYVKDNFSLIYSEWVTGLT